MQLIEIVQLVLVGFIIVSLLFFAAAYLGYRKKNTKFSSNKSISTKPLINTKNGIELPLLNTKKNESPIIKDKEPDKSVPPKKTENSKPEKIKINGNRFEVFNPSKENLHYPKTLNINVRNKPKK